ncbi:MAG: hypothetical protein IIB00_10285 [candidate division Zixibacteria bacterium]|nr:hypothetical protein [candidate division Zixibacteria bacterium]
MGIRSILVNSQLGLKSRRCKSSTFSFPEALYVSRNVLILLPQGLRELTMVKPYLPEFADIFSPAEMYLLATPGSHVVNIFPRKGYRILAPGPSQTTWTGLPKASYLKTLTSNNFDLMIDLNLNENPFAARTLLEFEKALKIGVGGDLGEPFYNLEIKTGYMQDERNIYRAFVDMISELKSPHGPTGTFQREIHGLR